MNNKGSIDSVRFACDQKGESEKARKEIGLLQSWKTRKKGSAHQASNNANSCPNALNVAIMSYKHNITTLAWWCWNQLNWTRHQQWTSSPQWMRTVGVRKVIKGDVTRTALYRNSDMPFWLHAIQISLSKLIDVFSFLFLAESIAKESVIRLWDLFENPTEFIATRYLELLFAAVDVERSLWMHQFTIGDVSYRLALPTHSPCLFW